VTFDQLNEVLPPTPPARADRGHHVDALRHGLNVSEAEDADSEEETKKSLRRDDNELVEVTQKAVTEVKKSEPGERTDDPVRMYLREMGTVEPVVARGRNRHCQAHEAGREAMIAGLCESPLTFQAIIIWRDELNEGKIFLRDIIDLEATYAGPDAKNNMNPLLAAPLGPTASRCRQQWCGDRGPSGPLAYRGRRPHRRPDPVPSPQACARRCRRGESTSEASTIPISDDDYVRAQ